MLFSQSNKKYCQSLFDEITKERFAHKHTFSCTHCYNTLHPLFQTRFLLYNSMPYHEKDCMESKHLCWDSAVYQIKHLYRI